jgi:hypothetical protein
MSRSDIFDRGFPPDKAKLLLGAYDAVWGELASLVTPDNSEKVQRAISTSLLRKASDTPLDGGRLRAYALDRASRRLAGNDN